jgi:hypothetical protein
VNKIETIQPFDRAVDAPSSGEIDPAPFKAGDKVRYRPRPGAVETVDRVEYRHQGWQGWLVRTVRQLDPAGKTLTHRWSFAEDFDRVAS